MASVVHHAAKQVQDTGRIKLFRSHRAEYGDGEQKRDFIHVDDVVNVCLHFFAHREHPGIYNVGTGQARTFNDLANAVFAVLGKTPSIEYIDIPADIRDAYQYFTQAEVGKLRGAAYETPFQPLEEGVARTVGQ
jgi:ADP-L-glycero-D-manno-heptose 6-epimerase